MKTIRKNTLKKLIESGKIIGKCTIKLSDDFQYDNSVNFGKMENFLPVRIRIPEYTEYISNSGAICSYCSNEDRKEGYINLDDIDIKNCTVWENEEGLIEFRLYNSSYVMRIVENE